MSDGGGALSVLMVTAGTRNCALPLEHVRESLRPLPVEKVAGVPAYVEGMAVIRGRPVPVVDLQTLLGETTAPADPSTAAAGDRLVLLQLGQRQVALRVQQVVGVRQVDGVGFAQLPPVLGDAGDRAIAAVGVKDAQLMLVLGAARLLPADLWATLERRSA